MFCDKLNKAVKNLFRKIDKTVIEAAKVALSITEKLKAACESNMALLITDLIPGNADNELRASIVAALQRVLILLEYVSAGEAQTTNQAKVLVEKLKVLPHERKNAILIKIAGLLSASLHGNKEKQNVYDLAAQAQYSVSKPVK